MAWAQKAFPNKPIRIVVPNAPGGAADITARTLGEKASRTLGQPFVLESRENHPRYCTTIVYDSLPVSIQQQVPWQTVPLSVIKGDLLFPKAFIELKGSQLIYQQAPSAK